MSTARYFVTEQEEKAKNWEMLQRSKSLEAKLVRLHDELHQFSLSWTLLGNKASDRALIYQIGGDDIEALKVDIHQTRDLSDPKYKVDLSVPAKHFELANIQTLLTDLTVTKKELSRLKSELQKLGV
jgi:hypothetical protein